MKIETKFDLNQCVWGVSDDAAYRIVKCDVCITGKLTIGKEQFVCPKCAGRSANPQYAGRKWYVFAKGTIGKIQTEYYSPGMRQYDDFTIRHTYMIDSTGVGSGRCWDEELIFPSREEAQAECDKKNGLLNLTDEATMAEALV